MALLMRPAIIAIMAILSLAVVFLFPGRGDTPAPDLSDIGQLRAAYAHVVPGMPAQQLAALGFDRARPGAQTLSSLAAMEFFMPRDSDGFDRLDPAVRACLEAADRCGAYVFAQEAQGDGALGLSAHAAPEDERIVFLVRSGKVVWKKMGR